MTSPDMPHRNQLDEAPGSDRGGIPIPGVVLYAMGSIAAQIRDVLPLPAATEIVRDGLLTMHDVAISGLNRATTIIPIPAHHRETRRSDKYPG